MELHQGSYTLRLSEEMGTIMVETDVTMFGREIEGVEVDPAGIMIEAMHVLLLIQDRMDMIIEEGMTLVQEESAAVRLNRGRTLRGINASNLPLPRGTPHHPEEAAEVTATDGQKGKLVQDVIDKQKGPKNCISKRFTLVKLYHTKRLEHKCVFSTNI
jgi:hypothetical protein